MTEVKEGTKIEADEAEGLDPKEMGVMIAGTPPEPEVEGQAVVWGYTRCPWCGNVGRSVVDTRRYRYYTCGFCGRMFRA